MHCTFTKDILSKSALQSKNTYKRCNPVRKTKGLIIFDSARSYAKNKHLYGFP